MSKKYKNLMQRFFAFERTKNGYIYCQEYSYEIILKSYKYVMKAIKNGDNVVRHPKDGLAGTGTYAYGSIKYPLWMFTYYNNCYNTRQLEKLWCRFSPNYAGEYNAYKVADDLHNMLRDCTIYFRRGYSADTFDYLEKIYLVSIIKELILDCDIDVNGILINVGSLKQCWEFKNGIH